MSEISNISYIKFLKKIGISYFSQEKPNNFFNKNLLKNNNQTIKKIENVKNLNDLNLFMRKLNKIDLKNHSNKFVFGEGNIKTKIMLIGGIPGIEENKKEKPFVGKVGQLLDNMLNAIKIKREEIYISYVIPLYRNNNQNLTNNEILKYLPFIQKKIEIINPKIIILLGPIAAKSILNSNSNFEDLRGKWHDYKSINMDKSIKCLVTYDPNLLLQSSNYKKYSWRDLKMLQKKINDEN